MDDRNCVKFLQWALPLLGMRWRGFKKVRRQVCRRISSRIKDIGLHSYGEYADFIQSDRKEWNILGSLCRVTISRFCRDQTFFKEIGRNILPALVDNCLSENRNVLRIWSVGCASGEEPYSLSMTWEFMIRPNNPSTSVEIIATDIDDAVLERARIGIYAPGSLEEVPPSWLDRAFLKENDLFRLRDDLRRSVRFVRQDVRHGSPPGPFDLITCRNLVFTYFDINAQTMTLDLFNSKLRKGSALGIGSHEHLPSTAKESGFMPWPEARGVYFSTGRIAAKHFREPSKQIAL